MSKQQWQVMHFTVFDGWQNVWTDDAGKPMIFSSRRKAQAELNEFLADTREAANKRHMASRYLRDEFRVVPAGGQYDHRIAQARNPPHC